MIRIAYFGLMCSVLASLWSCSDEGDIIPSQVVVEVPLDSFPLSWLSSYAAGQTHVFVNDQGEEQAWDVARSTDVSSDSNSTNDSLFITNVVDYRFNLQNGDGQELRLQGLGNTFAVISARSRQEGGTTVNRSVILFFSSGNGYDAQVITSTYSSVSNFDYRFGPAYPRLGSDSLYLRPVVSGLTRFAELLFVQESGWATYQDTTGVEWVLDRVEG